MQENFGLTIALPSGKSMEEPTLELLKAVHVTVHRSHARMCMAHVSGFPGIDEAVFFKPGQITGLVSTGAFWIGITGHDTLLEDEKNRDGVVVVADLPYSRSTSGPTRCVLFAREGEAQTSLASVAEQEVISEYPNETRTFFDIAKIPARVVGCSGSAESFVVVGLYAFGVALTETGTSLRVNGLKEIAELFTSQTVLIANRKRYGSDRTFRDLAGFLGRLLVGALEARGKVYLLMHVPKVNIEAVYRILPSLKAPTVQPLSEDTCSVASVVPVQKLNELKMQLSELGASGFVELDPGSVM